MISPEQIEALGIAAKGYRIPPNQTEPVPAAQFSSISQFTMDVLCRRKWLKPVMRSSGGDEWLEVFIITGQEAFDMWMITPKGLEAYDKLRAMHASDAGDNSTE